MGRSGPQTNGLSSSIICWALDYTELPYATGPDYKGPWLAQRPFVSKWTYFLLPICFRDGGPLFRDYLYNIVKYNIAYDYFVRDMLTATALFKSASGPAGFLLRHEVDGLRCADVMHEDTLDEIAVHTTKLFLGVKSAVWSSCPRWGQPS